MFTIHETDRDGNPYRELARTEFVDIARAMALAITRWRWPESSRTTQNMIDEGTGDVVVLKDGEPYGRVVLQRSEEKKWVMEGGTW